MIIIQEIDKLEDYVPLSMESREVKHRLIAENHNADFMVAMDKYFPYGLTREQFEHILCDYDRCMKFIRDYECGMQIIRAHSKKR